MSRILVIGGFGFYGSKVVASLRARGHEVVIGARRPEGRADAVSVDLAAPETFAAFAGFDAIVNCSDSVNAPPDAAVRHVLTTGGAWMEMGAHLESTERLLELAAGRTCVGTAVIGVGVFPGLSTALARAVAMQGGGGCETIELGIRLSPLSGAGRANCALMAESLFVPATRYENGALMHASTALGARAVLDYAGQRATSVNVALPDTLLIRRSTGVPTVITYFALVPAWLRFNFSALAWMCRLLRVLKRPLAWLVTWQMIFLRGWLLRNVETRLQLLAVADRGTARERSRELSFADGQQATAAGTVAAVEAWIARDPEQRPVGVFGVGELFELDELLPHVASE
jgi:short subunit dehydrogenase-like uncharacterized protein